MSNEITREPNQIVPLTGMYKDYFLDYASYVILERAVPMIEDGCKPGTATYFTQHEGWDDGRYNKVANIIGHVNAIIHMVMRRLVTLLWVTKRFAD